MVARLHHRVGHYLVLLAAGACLFLWNLGGANLWDVDEGRNARAAYEMYESGNYIVPTLNGQLRADKPALLYWLQAIAYHWFGVSEFSARLPSALAALAALLLAYELGRTMFGTTAGFLAGLIAASTPMLCGAARFANPDALLHLCTVATLWLFWLGHRQPTTLWWIGLGVTTGFGMLAKGPVGLILPALAALAYLIWDGRARLLLDRRMGWGLLAFALVALPWYVWVAIDTKANFLRGFLLQHNLGRFTSTMESHAGSPLYYPVVILAGTAPWSVFIGGTLWFAVAAALRQARSRQASPDLEVAGPGEHCSLGGFAPSIADPDRRAAHRFLLAWIVTYLVFFSASATKLPNYVLPVVVPFSVLTAWLLDGWRREQVALPRWFLAVALLALSILGVGLGTGLLVGGGVGAIESLGRRAVPGLAALAWIGAIPVLGAMLSWHCLRRRRRGEVLAVLSVVAVSVMVPLAAWGSMLFNAVKAPHALVEQAGARQPESDVRVAAWRLEHLPSLNFYAWRDVIPLTSERGMRELLKSPLPVYVFLPAATWESCHASTKGLAHELGRQRDMYRHAEVVVIGNRPAANEARVAGGRGGF